MMMNRRSFSTALVGGAATSFISAPVPAAISAPVPARNVVLVHGLFADGSSWSEVIARLQVSAFHHSARCFVKFRRNSERDVHDDFVIGLNDQVVVGNAAQNSADGCGRVFRGRPADAGNADLAESAADGQKNASYEETGPDRKSVV